MALLMDFTNEGVLRTIQIWSGLKFVVSHVAYGASGYNVGTPTVALPLVPAATSLVAEVYRKSVPLGNTVIDTITMPRGQETTYTTVGGDEFSSILGEAGLYATVTDPGGTGLPLDYQFLLAQAHFPRVVFSLYCRLAIEWPINYASPPPPVFLEEFEFSGAWDGTVANTVPTPDFDAPSASLLEEFEFAGSWDGTVANTVPQPDFNLPSASFLEEFDTGWDGV